MTGKRRSSLSRVTLAVILAGSALLALRAVASYRAASRSIFGGGPSAEFERTEHDFGVVAAGEELSIPFAIRNSGSQRLVLTPEGCFRCPQRSGREPVMVPPGGTGEVVVTLSTAALSGEVREAARYTTSDPHQPRVEFVVTGRVKSD